MPANNDFRPYSVSKSLKVVYFGNSELYLNKASKRRKIKRRKLKQNKKLSLQKINMGNNKQKI